MSQRPADGATPAGRQPADGAIAAGAHPLAWFDCFAGASGDMCLGALVAAGVPVAVLQEAVDAVGTESVRLVAEPVTRHGIGGVRVGVEVRPTSVVRTWANVRLLLDAAGLPEPVRAMAHEAFRRLADAEARVHRTSPEQVHFHEVGGLDAVADIVGTAAGLHHLGVTTVTASPVALGSGMVRVEHGLLPVPTPAVVELLAEAGAPVYAGAAGHEMCTPTGAALLATTVSEWGPMPPMQVARVGYGAGERDLDGVPNLLRLVVGAPSPQPAQAAGPGELPGAVLLEANVDDLDPRVWPHVIDQLIAAGAVDAWLTPILMKKGRPAHTVSALVPPGGLDAVRAVLFAETTTIGARELAVAKHALARSVVTVDLADGRVRVKVARMDGRVVTATPEFDDVAALARQAGAPLKAVLAEAAAAARDLTATEGHGDDPGSGP